MNIRRLVPDDYYKGYLDLLEQLTCVHNGVPITFEEFSDQFHKLNSSIYVIETDGLIIATGTLLIEQKFIHRLGSVAHIEDIVVLDSYRGQGIGKVLVDHLVQMALNSNSSYKVILDCSEKNQEFYEKCGLTKKGIQMAYYRL